MSHLTCVLVDPLQEEALFLSAFEPLEESVVGVCSLIFWAESSDAPEAPPFAL